MNEWYSIAFKIFSDATTIEDPECLQAFLDERCHNPEIRNLVNELLDAEQQAESFLEKPVVQRSMADTVTHDVCLPGMTIGPYKLLQKIGEGGFGIVYMAQQVEPVKRKVAVKIIKPGMDTREVVTRFEAERQALALMDHPNIANVLDAGATSQGRPYFVMELVKGGST